MQVAYSECIVAKVAITRHAVRDQSHWEQIVNKRKFFPGCRLIYVQSG